jgi:hypothetical protein
MFRSPRWGLFIVVGLGLLFGKISTASARKLSAPSGAFVVEGIFPNETTTPTDEKPIAFFSHQLDRESLTLDNFKLVDSAGNQPSGKLYYYDAGADCYGGPNCYVQFIPDGKLRENEIYVFSVSRQVRDSQGEYLGVDYAGPPFRVIRTCLDEDYSIKTQADLERLASLTCVHDLLFDPDNQLETVNLILNPLGTRLEGKLQITGSKLKEVKISEKITGGTVSISETEALEFFYLRGAFGLVSLENNKTLKHLELDVFANDYSITDTVIVKHNPQLESAFIKLGYVLHHGPHGATVVDNENLKKLVIQYPDHTVVTDPNP